MSPSKAIRRALSRAADVLWDLALVCQSVTVELRDQDGVVACLTDDDLLLLLDGPDGALGLAAIDRSVLTGVIEVQTIAQVTTMEPEERSVTSTDAAMVAPLIDAALARFAENLHADPMHPQVKGFQFGAMVEDRRAAGLLLDAPQYHSFEVQVDLALGRRKGTIRIILPQGHQPAALETAEALQEGEPNPHAHMLEQLQVRLAAVLGRISLPLGKAQSLKPGDVLTIHPDSLEDVHLQAAQGHLVARGKLGQLNGMKAVRLTWPIASAPAGAEEATDVDTAAAKTKRPKAASKKSRKSVTKEPTVPSEQSQADAESLPDLPQETPGSLNFDEASADREFADLADPLLDFEQSLLD